MKRISLLIVLFLIAAANSPATDISGPVSGVWDPSGNPYNLIDSTWVPYGETLTILAGVDIDWISNGIVFTAFGTIEVQGEEENRVDITCDNGYLDLHLEGDDVNSDYLQYADLKAVISLSGSGHSLYELYIQYASNSYAWAVSCIKGPADNISIMNSIIDIETHTTGWAMSAYAFAIYDINGVIQNCTINAYAQNDYTGIPPLSAADACGITTCTGLFEGNTIHVYAQNTPGGLGSQNAYGIFDCIGAKRENFIHAETSYIWGGVAGIYGDASNGDAINNTIHLSSNGISWGIKSIDGDIINNAINSTDWNGIGIEFDSSSSSEVKYNTVWGFSEYFSPITPPVTDGNRTEDPLFDQLTGLLLSASHCTNQGNPDSIYNDPDGTRNDRGWVPFDPENGANLIASQNSLDFGQVAVGSYVDRMVTFTNIGQAPGEIETALGSEPVFSAISGVPSGPIVLGDSMLVTIRFAPTESGFNCYDEIAFNGSAIPIYHIEVMGDGVEGVSGNIVSPVVWTRSNSPYMIFGSVNVLSTGSLTIEPGVEVFINGLYHIYAEGELHANGALNDSIRFVPFTPDIQWYGIDIVEGPGLKELSYCVIEGAVGDPLYDDNGGAISILNEEVHLTNCRISANSAQAGAGVYVDNGTLSMESNLFTYNVTSGEDSLSIIYIVNSVLTMEKNNLFNNEATNGILFVVNSGISAIDENVISYNTGVGARADECEISSFISNIISNNSEHGICSDESEISCFENNLINGNSGVGLQIDGTPSCIFGRCTVANNTIGIEITSQPGLTFIASNLIVFGNGSGTPSEQLSVTGGTAELTYCDVQGGWSGLGNIDLDPLFIDPDDNDYHLQSQAGRYYNGQWVQDSLTSPCIDAGDPLSAFTNEPEPNGDRINMGAYGNTAQASLSENDPQYFSGPVSGTWNTTINPKYIIGDVYIPENQTLLIEPGVELIFLGHYMFKVSAGAILFAIGTVSDSILFTAENPDTGWYGIRFYNASDSSRVEYCHIEYGKALDYQDGGGGIYCYYSNPTIKNCTIKNCIASMHGGGICGWHSSPTIISNYISGCNAQYGGGIYCCYSDSNITQCNITGNSASLRGGGVYLHSSSIVITGCRISDNWAILGGGIESYWFSNGVISFCTINNNSANSGGGVHCWNSIPTILNCTITQNNSGGIYCDDDAYPVVINSVVWDNVNVGISYSGPYLPCTYSNIQDTLWPGTGNISADPLFVSTIWNDYRLQWGSPCIDAGNPFSYYNDPDGTVADMGAYYYDQSIPVRILLTPHDAPIEIPLEGGSFDYIIQATNIDPVTQLVNIWCDATLPDGTIYGPVLGPVSVSLDSGITISRRRTQTVPAGAPAGLYSYNAYAVAGSDSSMDSFTFEKLGSDGSDGIAGWLNTGESFEELAVPETGIPKTYSLDQNYPNPFNPTTTIRYSLPEASLVHLEVYDVAGRLVTTLINGWRDAGYHQATFDAFHLPSCVYIYRLRAGDFTAIGKMVLIK